jgi:hypothetical protein
MYTLNDCVHQGRKDLLWLSHYYYLSSVSSTCLLYELYIQFSHEVVEIISMKLNKERRGLTEKKCQSEWISSTIVEVNNLTLCRWVVNFHPQTNYHGKETSLSSKQEAQSALKPIWTSWKWEKYLLLREMEPRLSWNTCLLSEERAVTTRTHSKTLLLHENFLSHWI